MDACMYRTMAAFRYSLPVLKIYNIRNVHCRFSVLAVNTETQSMYEREILAGYNGKIISVKKSKLTYVNE